MILETQQLTKKYRDLVAVNDVNLQVSKGEIFGFLGPNGAGKTTTLGMILGLIHPTSGHVKVLGQPVTPFRNSALSEVGSMVGTPGMLPYFSAVENLSLLADLKPKVSRDRIIEVLEEVDLMGAAKRLYRTYSTGMKQRLGLAAALLHHPKLLVLDEPTNGLDPAGMKDFRDLIRKQAEKGVTVFLSSHLLHEVELICDRVAVLNRGMIIRQGTIESLRINQSQRVCLRVPDIKAVVAVLQKIPGIKKVTVMDSLIHVEGLSANELMNILMEHKIVPQEIYEDNHDLESIFLELTQ